MTRFIVKGCGKFPYYMLFYDECYPLTSSDAYKIERFDGVSREVTLETSNPFAPTKDMWRNLRWKVIDNG